MYSATPRLREDWKALLHWVLDRAGLGWEVIDYDPPAPLNALWARNDLGLAMMCGLPFAQRAARAVLVAAPVPSPARYGGKPVYFTDIVVRADSPHRRLEDTFGGVVGYTLQDSFSGGVAFRDHLAAFRGKREGRLFRGAVGQLIHARGVIDALVRGDIDVGPLDSYYHDLLRQDDPRYAGQVRVIGSTAARPIPPLVATAFVSTGELRRLQSALGAVAGEPLLAPLRQRLLLSGFAFPGAAAYGVLQPIAARAVPAFEDL
jgi:ABC-type phosphate/phosphonate transport system substrate-binding protein